MEDNKDYFKVTIDSKNFQQYNEQLGKFSPFMDAATISKAENLLKTFERAVQSASNTFKGFQSSLKRVATRDDLSNPKDPVYSGRFQQSFYVQTKELSNVMRALKAHNAALVGANKVAPSIGDAGFDISSTGAREVSRYKTLRGREAVSLAKEGLSGINGRLEHAPTAKNPDRYRVSVLMGEDEYSSLTEGKTGRQASGAVTRYINESMRPAERVSGQVARQQKQAEEERKARAEARRIKAEEKKREAQERKARIQEREKAARSKRKALTIGRAILAGITLATVLLRKIGTTIIQNAIATTQNAVSGNRVGLSASTVRLLNTFDKAHGIQTPTINAVTDVQTAFGDIFTMDHDKLNKLARVLGPSLASLVRHGIGEGNPFELFKMIIDSYFSKFLQNKGTKGILIEELTAAMPNLGAFLNQMISEHEQGKYKDMFTNVDEYLATTGAIAEIKQKGKTEEELQLNFGQSWQDAKANLQAQLDNALGDFITSLNKFVDKVRDATAGLEAEEKVDSWNANKQRNRTRIKAMEGNQELLDTAYSSDVNTILGTDYVSLGDVDVNKYSKKLLENPEAYRAVLMHQLYAVNIERLLAENRKISDVRTFQEEMSDINMTQITGDIIEAQAGNIADNLLDLSNNSNWRGSNGFLEQARKLAITNLRESNIPLGGIKSTLLNTLETTPDLSYSDRLLAYLVEQYNKDTPNIYNQIDVRKGADVYFATENKKGMFLKYLKEKVSNKDLIEGLIHYMSGNISVMNKNPYYDAIKSDTTRMLNESGNAIDTANKKIRGGKVSYLMPFLDSLENATVSSMVNNLLSTASSPLAFGMTTGSQGGATEHVLRVQFDNAKGETIASTNISLSDYDTGFEDSIKLNLSNFDIG